MDTPDAASQQQAAMKALGRVPSGLFILTAGSGPSAVATLVSFVQQLSLNPPLVGVALQPGRAAATALAREKRFALNVLHAGDKTLLRAFAKASLTGDAAYEGIRAKALDGGGAALLDACACLECDLTAILETGGDHQLFVGRVVGGELLGDPAFKPTVHIRHDGGRY